MLNSRDLVDFTLSDGTEVRLTGVEFGDGVITGERKGGHPYAMYRSDVVRQRLARDSNGWVGGRRRKR